MKDKPTIREEANAIVAHALRNGFLEDLHAGEYSELLEDKRWSRITDDEMKRLMIQSCEQVAMLLKLKEDDPEAYWQRIARISKAYTRNWIK